MKRILLVVVLALSTLGGTAAAASAGGSIVGAAGGQFTIPPPFRGFLTFGDAAGGGSGVFVPTTQPFATVFAGSSGVTSIFPKGTEPVVLSYKITCVDIGTVNGRPVLGYTTQLTRVQGPDIVERHLPVGFYFTNRIALSSSNKVAGKTTTAFDLIGPVAPAGCSPVNGPPAALTGVTFGLELSGAFGPPPRPFPYALGYLPTEPPYLCLVPNNPVALVAFE